MSSFRITLLLLIILSALGAYLFFVEVPTSHKEAETRRSQQQLIPFDDRAITQFTMTTSKETIAFTQDHRGRWFITLPLQARADSREVGKVLRALTIGKVERIIQEDGKHPDQYGLNPPHLSISLTAGKQTEEIALGTRGPLLSTLYARKKSDGKIVLTTLDPMTFYRKSFYTFRQKNIMRFDRTETDRLRLQYTGKQLVLQRASRVHGLGYNWRLTQPIEGPADRTKVGLLLMALEGLTAKEFIDSEPEKRALMQTLGAPAAILTVRSRRKNHVVTIFEADTHRKAYAMISPKQPLYRINPGFIKKVTTNLFDIRDKRLLGMEQKDLAILTVHTPQNQYVLINQNNEWVLERNPAQRVDQETVALFVSRLIDLPAEFQVSTQESTLAPFGLDNPIATFTAVNHRGEEQGRLILGTRKRGLVYAKGAGLPGVYQARSTILTQIPSLAQLLATEE